MFTFSQRASISAPGPLCGTWWAAQTALEMILTYPTLSCVWLAPTHGKLHVVEDGSVGAVDEQIQMQVTARGVARGARVTDDCTRGDGLARGDRD